MQTVRRLLNEFIPTHYDLSLDIDTAAETLRGTATITGESTHGHVVLHAKGLEIDSVTINGKRATYQASDDDELEILHDELRAGAVIIVISYHLAINEFTRGIYASRYQDRKSVV